MTEFTVTVKATRRDLRASSTSRYVPGLKDWVQTREPTRVTRRRTASRGRRPRQCRVRSRLRAACRSRPSCTISLDQRARRPRPTPPRAAGKPLIAVIPGMVLISLRSTRPLALSRKKSQRAKPAAVDGREGRDGQSRRLGLRLVADVGGDGEGHHAVGVLGLVVVELVGRHDLARHRGARLARCRARCTRARGRRRPPRR